jgi:ABC-type antimicrobial peptide transport system permease subunit
MLKSIFTQILNRKRSNTWLVMELLLVFILTWFITDYLFVLTYNQNIPDGRDLRHTWQVTLNEYPDAHPRYNADESTFEAREANFARILRTLHDYPGIEAVGVSFNGSDPANRSYMGRTLTGTDDTTKSVGGQQITVDPGEDFFRVFAYTSGQGRQAVSMQDFDAARPRGVILDRMTAEQLFPGVSAVGKQLSTDEEAPYNVIGVVDDIKRFDYERPQHAFYVFSRLSARDLQYGTAIAVRSRASAGNTFGETFRKDMTERLQTGNFYLKSVRPYTKIAAGMKKMFGVSNDLRTKVVLMTFFLLNILLCVLGTFWYRINTRHEEIGIRKALGSSSASIRNILLLEGLCLLTIAMLPAIVIEYQFVRAGLVETLGQTADNTGLYLPDRTHLRFLLTNAITWAIMGVVILVAVGLPARRASALPPAEALHYE